MALIGPRQLNHQLSAKMKQYYRVIVEFLKMPFEGTQTITITYIRDGGSPRSATFTISMVHMRTISNL